MRKYWRGALLASLGVLCLALPQVAAAQGEAVTAYRGGPIELSLDFARILVLPQPVRTVVIGNPGIADAALNDERTVVLTGRTTGTTNLVLLDEAGVEIASSVLRVRENDRQVVTVLAAYSGIAGVISRTFSCVGVCRSILSVGDVNKPYFEPTDAQIKARQSFSGTAQR